MYTEDLVLNNLQWLICHKTPPIQTTIDKDCLNYKQICIAAFLLEFILGIQMTR